MTRDELLSIIEKSNQSIETELKSGISGWRRFVVISTDFGYSIRADENGCAIVGFIGVEDTATRLTKREAYRAATTFKARNGHGEIAWNVLGVADYLIRLKAKNDSLIEFMTLYK